MSRDKACISLLQNHEPQANQTYNQNHLHQCLCVYTHNFMIVDGSRNSLVKREQNTHTHVLCSSHGTWGVWDIHINRQGLHRHKKIGRWRLIFQESFEDC